MTVANESLPPAVEPKPDFRLHPEVILVGDYTLSCLRWTLEKETARLDDAVAENPDLAEYLAAHGWTTRMLAWGHILSGFMKQLDFDDERGRV